jgi:hypothetical protein
MRDQNVLFCGNRRDCERDLQADASAGIRRHQALAQQQA